MNLPNISQPPTEQPKTPSQQQPPTIPMEVNTTQMPPTSIQSLPIITKPQIITTTQVQQTPLALTTTATTTTAAPTIPAQLQIKPQAPSPHLLPQTTTQSQPSNQVTQHLHVPKVQSTSMPQATSTTNPPQPIQPITLTTATSSGPTALVIIPQHSTITTLNSTKGVSKPTPIATTVGITTAHVTLTPSSQSAPIQIQTTTATPVAPILLNAHQQSTIQPTLANRPPTTLPVLPVTNTSVNVKPEPKQYICCLLDNGIRCDRIAGNASFSARIQKIVGTKKMNFVLDPTARHAYICDHHKAIITVAKKSTTIARETKANAKNFMANSNANTVAPQNMTNFNDLSRQQTLQHPMNLELMNSQNRLPNNHATINNMNVRPGTQIAYSHYQGNQLNQVGSMDVMMSSGFESNAGDSLPSGSSGGVDVDLQQLQVNTLRRYKRHFRVQTRPGLNKMQLAESLKGHFRTLPIIEKEAITYFVYIVKCYRNKLDHNPKAD